MDLSKEDENQILERKLPLNQLLELFQSNLMYAFVQSAYLNNIQVFYAIFEGYQTYLEA